MTAPAVIARRQAVVAPVHPATRELAGLVAHGPAKRRPKVCLAGPLVRIGDQLLDQVEAVRLWAELGDALGLAERERRPQAWGWLADWLEDAFRGAILVEVREGKLRHEAHVVKIDATRAMARIAPYEVAHLRRPRPASRTWTGPVAVYSPGPLGVGPRSPDATLAFTRRTIRVGARELEAAPEVGP